jgi:hypothetical protein
MPVRNRKELDVRAHCIVRRDIACVFDRILGWRLLRHGKAPLNRILVSPQTANRPLGGDRLNAAISLPMSASEPLIHDPAHADMPHEAAVRHHGPPLPDLPSSGAIGFELARMANHFGEIDHLEEAHAPAEIPKRISRLQRRSFAASERKTVLLRRCKALDRTPPIAAEGSA